MDDLERTVAQHEAEIRNLRQAQRDMENRLQQSQRDMETRLLEQIRDVQRDMREEIARLDAKAEARDRATMERLNKFENKLDSALEKLRRATPPWVGPVIGSLIAIGGWLYHTR